MLSSYSRITANPFLLPRKTLWSKQLAGGERKKGRNWLVWGDRVAKYKLLPLLLKCCHLDMEECFMVSFLGYFKNAVPTQNSAQHKQHASPVPVLWHTLLLFQRKELPHFLIFAFNIKEAKISKLIDWMPEVERRRLEVHRLSAVPGYLAKPYHI